MEGVNCPNEPTHGDVEHNEELANTKPDDDDDMKGRGV